MARPTKTQKKNILNDIYKKSHKAFSFDYDLISVKDVEAIDKIIKRALNKLK